MMGEDSYNPRTLDADQARKKAAANRPTTKKFSSLDKNIPYL